MEQLSWPLAHKGNFWRSLRLFKILFFVAELIKKYINFYINLSFKILIFLLISNFQTFPYVVPLRYHYAFKFGFYTGNFTQNILSIHFFHFKWIKSGNNRLKLIIWNRLISFIFNFDSLYKASFYRKIFYTTYIYFVNTYKIYRIIESKSKRRNRIKNKDSKAKLDINLNSNSGTRFSWKFYVKNDFSNTFVYKLILMREHFPGRARGEFVC